ncbi:hypothetical protein MCACP_10160 [Neomoorella carbonis]
MRLAWALNRRMRIRMSGGVRGWRLAAPSYSIPGVELGEEGELIDMTAIKGNGR